MGGGAIWHFVTPNFVQAAVGPNNWHRRLKFCMQPLIVVNYKDHEENLRSEDIDLYFDQHELRKYGKIPIFYSNSNIISWSDMFSYFLLPHMSCVDIDTYIQPPYWPPFDNDLQNWSKYQINENKSCKVWNHRFFGIPITFLISRIAKHPRSLVNTNLLQLVEDKI